MPTQLGSKQWSLKGPHLAPRLRDRKTAFRGNHEQDHPIEKAPQKNTSSNDSIASPSRSPVFVPTPWKAILTLVAILGSLSTWFLWRACGPFTLLDSSLSEPHPVESEQPAPSIPIGVPLAPGRPSPSVSLGVPPKILPQAPSEPVETQPAQELSADSRHPLAEATYCYDSTGGTVRILPAGSSPMNGCLTLQKDKQGKALATFPDGQRMPPADAIYNLTFAEKGGHIAYHATLDCRLDPWGHWTGICLHEVVRDGRMSPPYSWVGEIRFSKDGTHLAYTAAAPCDSKLTPCSDGKLFVVRDDQQGSSYGDIQGLAYSPDSNKLAYVAGQNCDAPSFNENGGYSAACGRYSVVVNDRESRDYTEIPVHPQFSPDNEHLAYAALESCAQWDDGAPPHCLDGKLLVVMGHHEIPVDDLYDIQSVRFSPDGSHLYVAGSTGEGQPTIEKTIYTRFDTEPREFLRRYRGTLGVATKIRVKLQRNGPNLYGEYSFPNYAGVLALRGTVNEDGDFVLKEFGRNGEMTGELKGIFISEHTLEGQWTKPEGQELIRFSLTEDMSRSDRLPDESGPSEHPMS